MILDLTEKDTFLTTLDKIVNATESEITITIPVGHTLLDNVLNLKLLLAIARKSGKKVGLNSSDEVGTHLLAALFGREPVAAPKEPPKPTLLSRLRPYFSWRRFRSRRFALAFGWLLLLGLLLLSGYLWLINYVPRATVSLAFSQDTLTKSVLVNLAEGVTAVDLDKQIIPAQKLVVYATASAGERTTGKKTVGTQARGSIIVYNKTDHPKTFARNTLVSLVTTTSGSWLFTLDSAVTVPERTIASVSATPAGETTSYNFGQARVGVTAKEIGEKYNLPSGSQLNIGDEKPNDFLAKSDGDFSGGKETEVAVVTESDRSNLGIRITNELKDSLRQKLQVGIPVGLISASEGASLKIVGENFDRGIGETADTLNLTATGVGISYVFKSDDVKSVWQKVIQSSLPTNYTLSDTEKELSIDFSPDTVGGSSPQLLVKGVSFVVPKYLAEDLQRNLAGKSLSSAKSYLEALQGVKTVKIEVWPPIFGLATKMPPRSDAIRVIIERP